MLKVLITGASSGIGKELCKQFSLAGYKLTLVVRDEKSVVDLVKELKNVVEIIVSDLSIPSSRHVVIDKIQKEAYDIVINNAGFGLYGRADTHSITEEKALVEVNVNAVHDFTLHAVQALKAAKKKGTILNVSSAAAFIDPFPLFATYAAAKAFVLTFSRSLDCELAPLGIRVLTAAPGPVYTAFRAKASKSKAEESKQSMSAEAAAAEIFGQIKSGKQLHVFSLRYNLMRLLLPFLPSFLVSYFARKGIESRLKN